MADPPANSKKHLLKRAEELGVVGRSRMTKAELAEAIARQEAVESAAQETRQAVWKTAADEMQSVTQQVQDALRGTARAEMQSATQRVQGAVRAAAQPAARQVRDTLQEVLRKELQSAAQLVRSDVRTVVQQEAQLAARQIQSDVRAIVLQEIRSAAPQIESAVRAVVEKEVESAARKEPQLVQPTNKEPEPSALQPLRSAQHNSESWWRRTMGGLGRTLLIPIILALITSLLTSLLTSSYISSRILDRALLGSTDPVSAKLFFDRDNGVQGLTWALPKPLGQLSGDEALLLKQAAGRVDEFNESMRGREAVDVNASFIKLIVTGQRQAGVVITDMRAKIDECTAPLTGTLFYGPPEGERENIQLVFNLDEDVPIAREVNPKKNFGDPDYLGISYFKNHTIPLALGEDQVFSIAATTSSRYCKWYIDMEIFVSGHTEHIEIGYRPDGNDDQRPLQITALANLQSGGRSPFAAYSQLYVLDRKTNPAGFFPLDPQTYIP